MRKSFRPPTRAVLLAALLSSLVLGAPAASAQPADVNNKPPAREIFVPFEDLNVLLDAAPQRVFLTRQEYEQLLEQAQRTADSPPPVAVTVLHATYQIALEEGRARISGVVEFDVLARGLQSIELELAGAGVLAAVWENNQQTAALGRDPEGRSVLFVEGPARRRLRLELTAPLTTSAAQQTLELHLPQAATLDLAVTAPGDVELKQGAQVLNRASDGQQTQFDLAAPPGPLALVFSLNNRIQQRERVMLARSVIVDEVAIGVERLHATIAFSVLHGAAEQFEFEIPADFEITEVRCDLLERWRVVAGADPQQPRQLILDLRQPTSESTTVTLAGVRLAREEANWSFPRVQPLGTSGHAAVLGLLVEDRIQVEDVRTQSLVPIDRQVLHQAFASAAAQRDAATLPTRAVLAYYAPHAQYDLTAKFQQSEQQLEVVSNLVLHLSEQRHELVGVFSLSPKVEKLFALNFEAPAGWQVTSVRDAQGSALPFEEFRTDGPTRIHVRLAQPVPPGSVLAVEFSAFQVPTGWLDPWEQQRVGFPDFQVADAEREIGAVAVATQDDLVARPESIEGLSPLNDDERQQFGLGKQAELAFRFEQRPFAATFSVTRLRPNMTARSLTFFRIDKTGLHAYYEIEYVLREASTRRLQFSLPDETPGEIGIHGLHGTVVKQFHSTLNEGRRQWEVLLAENVPLDEQRTGRATLAVSLQQTLPPAVSDLELPMAVAEQVQYQTGFVAVEGDTELETRVATQARKVDVGELAAAQYQVGRNLLGTYGFLGQPTSLQVTTTPRDLHPLPEAIVEQARLWTIVATSGKAQTHARFGLRTKALLLEVRLPSGAELWSVLVDDVPISPQREDQVLLINLTADQKRAVRQVEIAYQFETDSSGLTGQILAAPPQLQLPGKQQQPSILVPITAVQWQLLLPKGYEVTRTDGTVTTQELARRPAHPFQLATRTYTAMGSALFPAAREAAVYPSQAASDWLASTPPSGPASEVRSAPQTPGGTATYSIPEGMAAPIEQPMAESAAEMDQLAADGSAPPIAAPGQDLLFEGPAGGGAGMGGMGGTGGMAGMGQQAAAPPVDSRPPDQDLLGVRSLRVDVERLFQEAPPRQITDFASLGEDPLLAVRVLHRAKLQYLAWACGLAVALIGVLLTKSTWRTKLGYLALVVVMALIFPAVTGWSHELYDIASAVVLAASLLLPYYLFMAVARLLVRAVLRTAFAARRLLPASAASLLIMAAVPLSSSAQEVVDIDKLLEQVRDLPPVQLPSDAVVVPYDPESGIDPRKQDSRLLVPYDKYVELWNRAHPDKPLAIDAPPAEYAVGAAQFQATLEGADELAVRGTIELHGFTDRQTIAYLPLAGGVLVEATLDGQPARIQVVAPGTPPDAQAAAAANVAPAQAAAAPAMPATMISVVLDGQGKKTLQLELRVRLERQGGWRRAEVRLPVGTVGSLTLTAPEAQTELRLNGVADKVNWETDTPGQQITTALLPQSPLAVQWRPKVAEAQVDSALTVESNAALDVQEDGLRLAWQLTLQFRRARREEFELLVPNEYLVEKVLGANVRGWSREADPQIQRVRVALLSAATDREQMTLVLSRSAKFTAEQPSPIQVPAVQVEGAALHQGTVAIRRSTLVDVRTRQADGLSRTALEEAQIRALAEAADGGQRPLAMVPFQAFRYSHPDFQLQLEAQLLQSRVHVSTQAILRISERSMNLELQHVFDVERAPLHVVQIELPGSFVLQQLSEPEYVVTEENGKQLLTVYLASGKLGSFTIALTGSLGQRDPSSMTLDLPQVRVRGAGREQGQLVVEVDPAYRVRASGLENCGPIPLERTFSWLSEEQRGLARAGLSLEWQAVDYRGQLVLERREPVVRCTTLTNIHMTSRAIEETILLEFRVAEAGIRQLRFLLPERLAKARIRVPALRQKTIEMGAGGGEQPQMRVTLDLQDELMDTIRVVIENDQVLTTEPHSAPLPVIETGEAIQQYVTVQNSSPDEVEVVARTGIEELATQQDHWRTLADLDVTQGFLVERGGAAPQLVIAARPRAALETVAARIGLSETILVVDANGAFRAVQQFQVENSTEQYLELSLPRDAQLWTVHVAGQPAKPVRPRGGPAAQQVRIPLVKTETGAADYPVRIIYAGKLPPLGSVSRITFPLARTENIHVELSQVTLYLPESHRWLDFRGAQQLVDQAEYATGYETYFEDQVLRASRAVVSGSRFDRQRAYRNLEQLEQTLQSNRADYDQMPARNSKLAAQNSANLMLVEKAKEQIAAKAETRSPQLALDNRDQLNQAFEQQRFRRSKNVATNTKENFFYSQPVAPPADDNKDGSQQFNKRWFDEHQLAGKPTQVEAPPVAEPNVGSRSGGKEAELLELGASIQQRRESELAERTLELAKKTPKYDSQPGTSPATRPAGEPLPPPPEPAQPPSALLGGIRVLQDGGQGDPGITNAPQQTRDSRVLGDDLTNEMLDGSLFGAALGAQTQPVSASGMTSLQLEIPQQGQPHYFRATRGELVITAQAVPHTLIHRVLRLACGVVLAIAAAWALRRR